MSKYVQFRNTPFSVNLSQSKDVRVGFILQINLLGCTKKLFITVCIATKFQLIDLSRVNGQLSV